METFELIPIDSIQKNPYQPRLEFSKEKLQELALSIKENGLIQPIVVRKSPIIGYEILAGERRYRASLLAGLTEIPAIIKELSDHEMMLQAIIENLQRENLNPLEEAKAYQTLVEKGFTHSDIAEKMGKSRPYITNLIRLLALPPHILAELEQENISQAHARLLINLPPKEQDYFLDMIKKKDISVRKLESLLQEKTKKVQEPDYFVKEEEERLKKILGTEVQIQLSKNQSGKISISFSNQEEYERIINSLK